jgi:hypothetical protein
MLFGYVEERGRSGKQPNPNLTINPESTIAFGGPRFSPTKRAKYWKVI